MELNHLRYFYEVAKSGSFTEASRRLRISQSALSKSVASLEHNEGVTLLERSKKGVTLTALGMEIYLKSQSIFQAVTDIENTCRGTKEIIAGSFNFGASDHVTNYLLLEKLRILKTEHPQVIPSVFSGVPDDIVSLILKNEIEFGLFFTKVNIPGISYESIKSIEMSIVCHPKILGDSGTSTKSLSKNKAILKKHGLISSIKSQYQSHPSKPIIDLMGNHPVISFESNSQETQKRFCLEGGGIAFLARFMVEREIAQGQLVEIEVGQPLTFNLLLAKRKGAQISVTAKKFLSLL